MSTETTKVGTKVSYGDMANARCPGVVCDVETTKWGTQYVIAWKGYRAGEVTRSDLRQHGWRIG